ncbi:hypothetical protein D3C79_1085580 [compost metagenome]
MVFIVSKLFKWKTPYLYTRWLASCVRAASRLLLAFLILTGYRISSRMNHSGVNRSAGRVSSAISIMMRMAANRARTM